MAQVVIPTFIESRILLRSNTEEVHTSIYTFLIPSFLLLLTYLPITHGLG